MSTEFTITLIRFSEPIKRYKMQVRVIKETNQVKRFCIHAKNKELYLEKRLLEKRNQWKITGMVNCGVPSAEEFNDIIRQIEGYLTPKKSRYGDSKNY